MQPGRGAARIVALTGVRLREEETDDRPFLLALYRSTRESELALTDWNEQQKCAFVEMQFAAQHQFYRSHYPGAKFHIVECDGVAVGRLYIHERPDEIRVMDIAVLPDYRNRGIGTALLRSVLDDSAHVRRPVTIHVERFNPARRLYERLGFRRTVGETDDGIYMLMEARPWN